MRYVNILVQLAIKCFYGNQSVGNKILLCIVHLEFRILDSMDSINYVRDGHRKLLPFVFCTHSVYRSLIATFTYYTRV